MIGGRSIAEEGAGMGHACTAVTLANLVRLGNTDVMQRYECRLLAEAARKVTLLTTEKPCADRQLVYGAQPAGPPLTPSAQPMLHTRG